MTASRDRRAGSDHEAVRASSVVAGAAVVAVVVVVFASRAAVVAVDAWVALLLHAAAATKTRAGNSLRGTAVDPSDKEGHARSSGEYRRKGRPAGQATQSSGGSAMRPKHANRKFVAILIAAMVLAACGARVSGTEVSASRSGGAGSQSAATEDTVQSTASTVAGAAGAAEPGAAGAGGGPATTVASGATDNGGATDVGVTATSITVGNVATMSGPVPGLFSGAVYGTQAWVAYQNSLGGINGRKIRLDVRDDQFDTGQNRAQTIDLLGKAFALVGSFSLYDDAAVPQIEKAGVAAVQVPLANGLQVSPNNFSVAPVKRGAPTGPWNLFKEKFPQSIGAVGAIYGDVPAAKDNYLNEKNAMQSVGFKFVYERGYQPTETDFTADVIRMRSAGVKFFFTSGDVKTVARVAKAMQSQNFKPDAFAVFGPAYDATFVPLAGSAGEGVMNVGTQAMYLGEDAPYNPEVRLFLDWLHKVKPGYTPDLFAAYGWGQGRLFAKAVQDAGPKLTRAGLLAALRKIDDWNGYGMFPPVGPASKRPALCYIIEAVHNGKFERWNSPPPGFNCQNTAWVPR